MNRPRVHPDNHEELYDYYDQIEPSERLIKSIAVASSVLYRPSLHFADDAENELAEVISRGDRLLFASAHFTIGDQFALIAAMRKSVVLAPEAKNIFLIGKPSYAANPVLRPFFDAAGWLPVFRKQDYPESTRSRANAAKSLFSVCTSKIVDGSNMLLFPEGTRNIGDPRVPQKIQGGVGRIASDVSNEGVGVAIVPVVPWWGDNDKSSSRRPVIYIGNPINGPFLSKADVLIPLKLALNEGVHRVDAINKALKAVG